MLKRIGKVSEWHINRQKATHMSSLLFIYVKEVTYSYRHQLG